MEEQHKNIDDLFRQSLGDYREAPPAAAWERVATQLDADLKTPEKKYFFLRWLWVSLAIMLLIGGAWFIAAHQGHKLTLATNHSFSINKANENSAQNFQENESTDASENSPIADTLTVKKEFQTSLKGADNSSITSKNKGTEIYAENGKKAQKTNATLSKGNERNDTKSNSSGRQMNHEKSIAETASSVRRKPSKNLSEGKVKGSSASTVADAAYSSRLSKNYSISSAQKHSIKSAEMQEQSASQKNSLASNAQAIKKSRSAVAQKIPNENEYGSAAKTGVIKPEKTDKPTQKGKQRNEGKSPNSEEPSVAHSNKLLQGNEKVKGRKYKLAKASSKSPVKEKMGTPQGASSAKTHNEAIAKKLPPLVRQTEFKWQPAAKEAPAVTNEDEDAPALTNSEDEEQEPITLATGSGTSGGGGAGSGVEEKKHRKPQSFSAAAMAGYELPVKKSGVNQVSGGLRLLWHFDPVIALGIQPTFRFGNISSRSVGDALAYQQSSFQVDSVIRLDSIGQVDYRQYNISQKFDSISVAGAAISGTMWQLELPVILSYNIAKAWRLYLGASLNFGGKLNATSGEVRHFESNRTDTLRSAPGSAIPAKPASSFENYFGQSSLPPFSQYTPTGATVEQPASLRFGYLFGVGYDAKRFNFDVSIHQQTSGFDKLPKSVQDVFSTAAIRLSFGYYLVPPRNKRASIEP